MDKKINILLVDDHTIVRTGLKSILINAIEGIQVYEAWDAQSAKEIIEKVNFDLIISDLTFSKENRHSYFMDILIPIYKDIPVIILTMLPVEKYAKKYLSIGVKAYLNKESPDYQLVEAVKHVYKKGFYFKNIDQNIANMGMLSNPFDVLSNRELEVVDYLINGLSIKSIGTKLDLKITTVSTYKIRIFEKLEIDSIIDLARLYEQFRST
jgi:two-component system, NarL family, invasion response regulator UvrY